MNIHYLANQVYQISYAKPLYRRLGGTIMVTRWRKLLRFQRRLRKGIEAPGQPPPRVIRQDIKNLTGLTGAIISQSNVRIVRQDGQGVTIFMGHGTGDKKYGGNPEILDSYDYHFISGPKHLAKLEDVNIHLPEERLIPIGNPRFDSYLAGAFDREKYLDRLGVRDRSRPVILYAPTWKWGSGTLRQLVFILALQLDADYNLIVRPHHFDNRLTPWLKIRARMSGFRHIYFSDVNDLRYHDTMDDFAASDLLVSDTSSMVYEYLVTGKPIILIHTDEPDLHQMPADLSIDGKADVFDPGSGDDIAVLVRRNLEDQPYKDDYGRLLDSCFFFNDGRSTDRVVEFINGLSLP